MSEKFPEPNENFRSIDLGDLADWIDVYREKFGPWSRLARSGIFSMTNEEIEEQAVDSGVEPAEREVALAKAAQADIVRRNEKIAEEVGITLEFPGEEEEWATELRLNIGDGKKFSTYLASLTEPTESQVKGLQKVAEILVGQLTNGYDLNDAEDERLLELVASLKNIVTEYSRLAQKVSLLQQSAESLQETYRVVQGGYIKQHIAVQEQRLLLPLGHDGGFGPSVWHTDSSEEGYLTKWNEALETLADIKANPKAVALYNDVRDNLLQSVAYALHDMETSKSPLLNNKVESFLRRTKEKLEHA